MKKLITSFCLFLTSFLCFCAKRPLAPEIGDNISFPGAIVALNSTNFLVLNTSGNGEYSNGSIQSYSVNNSGIHSLQTVMPVPAHGSELAVSDDGKLVALSFDSSYPSTEIWFYDYSNSLPTSLSNLKLVLPSSVAKQSVKNLGIFRRSIDSSDTNYYVYGTMTPFVQEDNITGAKTPARVFVAKVNSAFTSTELQFILSYGLNDPKSLVRNSISNLTSNSSSIQYKFGFSSPTYDAVHDLFIAFPTGVTEGKNELVDALPYFAGVAGANQKTCSGGAVNCLQTDFRTVSLAAVDMADIVNSKSLNLSTYFVPLGWNQNGMSYASTTNGINILNGSDRSKIDVSSFSFQAGFWSSYWANSVNNGSGPTGSAVGCYSSTSATSLVNQYSILGDNSLFVVKRGNNGSNDKSGTESSSGYGNEVFGVTGLELLKANISSIKGTRGTSLDDSDFKNIANIQLIDQYNTTTPSIKSNWVNGASGTKNAGPLTFFMYSRTSQVKAPQSDKDIFKSFNTGIKNFGVLKFPGNVCLPYWARLSYSTSSLGRDSSWLTSNPSSLSGNQTYPNLVVDPLKPSIFSFQAANGEEACTDVSPVASTPQIFCINFIYGKISRFTVQQTDPVFTLN
ncbi:hypothetical protein [Spirobacillus cienkowskii]|uniref:hypothetical protein n=1 Tax=Spirobacillus cienkowskii TaxID=495820 RepID=UPI0030CF2EFE